MNKAELIAVVAEEVSLTKKATEEVVEKMLEEISNALAEGDKVVLSGFGTFEVRTRVARSGVDPRHGAQISIPEQKTPAFKCGKGLKEAVNK